MNSFVDIFDNLHIRDKFLKMHKLPNLITQEEIDNLNSPITVIGFVAKRLPTMKTLGLDGFADEVYQTLLFIFVIYSMVTKLA